jgi:hypothetical protein
MSEEDTRDMHNYIQQITLAKGSGEYCICTFGFDSSDIRMSLTSTQLTFSLPVLMLASHS